ncbi:MAG: DUF1549 domain-containing protein, partial [Verrucomicrobiota bacterium]
MRIAGLTVIAVFASVFVAAAKPVPVHKAARQIDALVTKGYAEEDITPNRLADDNTFVRRAYLDIVGRIPSTSETEEFLRSKDLNKRAQLIDKLLNSPGHLSHEFNFWADILRVTRTIPGQDPNNALRYANWVKDALAKNMPYDQFVRELVTADGLIDENGAVGFYLRDRGMPLDHMAATVQVFLGTQLVCAQCHDHPFDDWTQMDYYKLAAFSSPVAAVRAPDSANEATNEMRKVIAKSMDGTEQREAQRTLGNFTVNFRNSVVAETKNELRLPHDYQYNDAKPKEVVKPETPFGDMAYVKPGEQRSEKYAAWMTSPNNPQFTKVIANRLWKRALGAGVFEPVDNVAEDDLGSNPELMEYLIQLMKEVDYDMRAFYRVVYNTKTYQREASAYDPLSGKDYTFPGPVLRRMSAEQMWDSLVTLVRAEPDSAGSDRFQPDDSGRLAAWNRIEKQDPDELLKRQRRMIAQQEKINKQMDNYESRIDRAIKQKDAESAQKVVLEMKEFAKRETDVFARLIYWDLDQLTSNGYFRTPFRNQPQALVRKLEGVFRKHKFAQIPRSYSDPEARDQERKEKLAAEKKEKEDSRRIAAKLGPDKFKQYTAVKKYEDSMDRVFVRSSNVGYPAPENHFLRVFGQSDRELIENSNREASVPQTLKLMNGNAFGAITSANSALMRDLDRDESFDKQCDHVYTALLSRKPTDHERKVLRAAKKREGDNALEGITWALINTQPSYKLKNRGSISLYNLFRASNS